MIAQSHTPTMTLILQTGIACVAFFATGLTKDFQSDECAENFLRYNAKDVAGPILPDFSTWSHKDSDCMAICERFYKRDSSKCASFLYQKRHFSNYGSCLLFDRILSNLSSEGINMIPKLTVFNQSDYFERSTECERRKNLESPKTKKPKTLPILVDQDFWTEWGPCTVSCGSGLRLRERICSDCLGELENQIERCNVKSCPRSSRNKLIPRRLISVETNTVGFWTRWTQWTTCVRECAGVQSRRRTCYPEGRVCGTGRKKVDDMQNRRCRCIRGRRPEELQRAVHSQASSAKWSEWRDASSCSQTCGMGEMIRRRTCTISNVCNGLYEIRMFCSVTQCQSNGWNNWNPWSRCDATCGNGVRQRSRSCPTIETNCPGPSTQMQRCCLPQCMNGWSFWGPWSVCSATCNTVSASQSRSRSCPANMQCRGDATQSRPCSSSGYGLPPCVTVKGWTQWTVWAPPCAVAGSGGDQTRIRTCPTSATCPGETEAIRQCPLVSDPTWTDWQPWSDCSASCGPGSVRRVRRCINGNSCPGSDEEVKSCSIRVCPNWGPWGFWSLCSETCGQGEQTRRRSCPVTGECVGSRNDERSCLLMDCINPNWLRWSPWTECSVTCGDGTRNRFRRCSANGECSGENRMDEPCNDGPCACTPWLQWNQWGQCSETCGGEQRRTRDRPRSNHCPGGDPTESRNCAPCCVPWNSWEQWSLCSQTCGPGEQERIRTGPSTNRCPGGDPTEQRRCNERDCPCTPWTEWTRWSICSATCDGGEQSRTRELSDIRPCSGGEPSESRRCGEEQCPCIPWLQWGSWSACSSTCGLGESSRSRDVPDFGTHCPGGEPVEFRDCMERECACNPWEAWSDWSRCPVTCGGAEQTRSRDIPLERPCPGGEPVESQECGAESCPCRPWEDWEQWSQCSQTCGFGDQFRRRREPTGGDRCPGGNPTESQPCFQQECPCIPWETWEEWSACSVTCGGGEQIRSREKPLLRPCPGGEPLENRLCGEDECPCSPWLPWTQWSDCSETCEEGVQTRTRSEAEVRPCPEGDPEESRQCFLRECPCNPWEPWSEWSACSATCGTGEQRRDRFEADIRPCPGGEPVEFKECSLRECPCNPWLSWEPWSPCSATCGDGERVRTRIEAPVRPCIGGYPDESEECNEQECACVPWQEWDPWSLCSATCGEGTQFRNRQEPAEGTMCPGGGNSDSRICIEQECAFWQPWTSWSDCSVTCGSDGTRSRSRECSVFGQCIGDDTESEVCASPQCAVWLAWSSWSECSVTCGPGSMKSVRECSVPKQCTGEEQWMKSCNEGDCPCVPWLEWNPWSPCSTTCGDGQQFRERTLPDTSNACEGGLPEEGRICRVGDCAEWMPWQPWSPCTLTCGGGSQTRDRTCTLAGQCPGTDTEIVNCNENPCPEWGRWSEWFSCDRTCGDGTQTRVRTCKPTGACPGTSSDQRVCNLDSCRLDWLPWSVWSPCSATCGGGIQARDRQCPGRSDLCEGEAIETQICSIAECEIPMWSPWSPYSECSATCDGEVGSQVRTRACSVSGECPGSDTDSISCFAQNCPVWLEWSPWTDCSVTCGTAGQQTRTRQCSRPLECFGEPMQSKTCENKPCPIWTQWTKWTPCNKQCGGGERERQRTCSTQGLCFGEPRQTERCNLQLCIVPMWNAWEPWSACSTSCGDAGIMFRTRSCSEPDQCVGEAISRQICDMGPCAIWSLWSPWGPCSATCGEGSRLRTRTCPVEGTCLGSSLENAECFERACISQWEEWTEWSPCPVTCGVGQRIRTRRCPSPASGCFPGSSIDYLDCTKGICYVYEWSTWSSWSPCSVPCGGGFRRRARACPVVQRCPGEPSETVRCNTALCDAALQGANSVEPYATLEDGELIVVQPGEKPSGVHRRPRSSWKWTPWTGWTRCASSCGWSKKFRARGCLAPSGRRCRGRKLLSQNCFKPPCGGYASSTDEEFQIIPLRDS